MISINRDDFAAYENMFYHMMRKCPNSIVEINNCRDTELSLFNATKIYNANSDCWVINFKSESDYMLFVLKWG